MVSPACGLVLFYSYIALSCCIRGRSELPPALTLPLRYGVYTSIILFLAGLGMVRLIGDAWMDAMKTAGFERVPRLDAVEAASNGWCVVYVVSLLGLQYDDAMAMLRVPTRFALGSFVVLTLVLLAIVVAQGVLPLVHGCPESSAAASLAMQADAVANYTRGFCMAWCRANAATTAAWSIPREACGDAVDQSAYDLPVASATHAVETWCIHTLRDRDFRADAAVGGTDPFSALLDASVDNCPFTAPWRLLQLTALALGASSGVGMHYYAVRRWRRFQERGEEDGHRVL